ncbi:MAG: HAD family hydrolase [Sneathiella sp.]|nr:MAG: HAD family hydrolase [Sneathiella sp.]
MIKAILWDFGGVLTTSPFENFSKFETAENLPTDFIRTINSTNPHTNAWAQFERSDVTLEEFDKLFEQESAALGHPVSGKEIIKLLAGAIRPRMVTALKTCAQQYNCTCLTNNVAAGQGPGMTRDAKAQAEVSDVMALFRQVIESSKVGLRKPDPKIYEYACAEMGVTADQVVYLDDLGINLKPAAAMGMKTIKVVTEDQALADLEAATGLTFT